MTNADDYSLVRAIIKAGNTNDVPAGLEALERIRVRHKRYLDAAARVTDLANAINGHADPLRLEYAHKIRKELGDAYLGGPLL